MNVGTDKLFWTRWRAALVMAVVALALVFSQGTSLAAAKKSLVDINSASQAELEAVKGVGPATAKKIIANRPYKSLDELSKAGLAAKKIESFKSSLTVGGAVAPPTPAAAKEEKKSAKEAKKKGEAAPATQAKEPKAAEPGSGAPVDLNTADQKALEALPGIGPATAKKIIANRPYKSLDELGKAGLSAKKIESLKSSLTVGGAPAPVAPAAAKETRKKGEAATTQAKEPKAVEPGSGAPVDLNTADQKALEALPGVGPATAKKIIAARPFKSVDDLSQVKGMSKAKVEALKDKVIVAQEKTAAPKAKPAPVAPAPAASPAAEKPAVTKEPASPAKPAATYKGKGTAAKLAPGQKVNINTASKEDLDKLFDIGEVRAQAIIDGRPYKKIEDVMKVKGIKEGIFEEIKDHITVD